MSAVIGQAAPEIKWVLVGGGEQMEESDGPGIVAARSHGANPVAIIDPNLERARRSAATLGIDQEHVFARIDEVIGTLITAEDLERGHAAAMVAVPTHLHEAVVCDLLGRRFHVRCEKPIAGSAAGGRRMLDAARAANRILDVNLQYRILAEAAMDAVRGGAVGELQLVEGVFELHGCLPGADRAAFFSQKEAAGQDLLPHLLSATVPCIEGAPTWVAATASNHYGRARHRELWKAVDDTMTVVAGFDSGTLALYRVCYHRAAPYSTRRLRFLGTEGTLFLQLPGPEVPEDYPSGFEYQLFRDGAFAATGPRPPGLETCHVQSTLEFMRAIREGREDSRWPADQAIQEQAIIDHAYESLRLLPQGAGVLPFRD